MRTINRTIPHPADEAKKNELKDMLEGRLGSFLEESKSPTKTPEAQVRDLEEWLMSLIDIAFMTDHRNSLTIGLGDEDELTFPCFSN